MILTEEELQAKCKEWQKILRLQDWEIKIYVWRSRDMDLEGAVGEVEYNLDLKLASIHILDPVDYPSNLMVNQDMEATLVHELLHLHMAPFGNSEQGTLEKSMLEQAIESITRGLIDLHRKEVQHA